MTTTTVVRCTGTCTWPHTYTTGTTTVVCPGPLTRVQKIGVFLSRTRH